MPEVGPMLRHWRQQRRISQLDLALAIESSARHLSFVENGRSRPSASMILRLAEHLEVPVRQRNAMLVAAGYAPRYSELPLQAPEMGPLRDAVDKLMVAYDPYPALVFDAAYEVVAYNAAVSRVMLSVVDPRLTSPTLNLMRVCLHPDGLAKTVVNYPAWRAHLLERMERQMVSWPDSPLPALYREVTAYPLPDVWPVGVSDPGALAVAQPFQMVFEGQTLSFVTTASTFNTPLDVTVAELAIETFLPADELTTHVLWSSRR